MLFLFWSVLFIITWTFFIYNLTKNKFVNKTIVRTFNNNTIKQSSLVGNNSIIINGKDIEHYVGGKVLNIIESGDKTIINGVDISNMFNDSLNITINIEGNIERIDSINSEINIKGNVSGDVTNKNGNITCNDIAGNVENKNGNIRAQNINGAASTKNGNIH